jgi:AcrR family transcriptional regulator
MFRRFTVIDELVFKPTQARSQQTQERLLEATRELLEETVFEQLTIQQIAARAGCSVGTFYGRFKNKEAVLPLLLEEHYAEVEAETDDLFATERWVDASLEKRVSAVVDHAASIALRQPGLIRALVLRNYQRPESIPASIRASAQKILGRLYEVLLEARSEIRHPSATTAVEVGLLMVVTSLRERIVLTGATHSTTLSLDNKRLIEELKRALLAYLTAGTEAGRVPDRS